VGAAVGSEVGTRELWQVARVEDKVALGSAAEVGKGVVEVEGGGRMKPGM